MVTFGDHHFVLTPPKGQRTDHQIRWWSFNESERSSCTQGCRRGERAS